MNRNKYKDRRLFFYFLFGASILILLLRLVNIQIIDSSYKLSANNNVIKAVKLYPERGYIYDRNDKLIVSNEPYYDLMIIPSDIDLNDSTEVSKLLNISIYILYWLSGPYKITFYTCVYIFHIFIIITYIYNFIFNCFIFICTR